MSAAAILGAIIVLMGFTGLLFDLPTIKSHATRNGFYVVGKLAAVNYIAIPLMTVAVVFAFSAPPTLKLVLLTLSVLPCAPLVPAIVSIFGDTPEWSLFIFVCLSLMNILLVPLLMLILSLHWVTDGAIRIGQNSASFFVTYLVTIYGPMTIGALIRNLVPRLAAALLKYVRPLVPVMMLLALVFFSIKHYQEIGSLGWRDYGMMLLFELICFGASFLVMPVQQTSRLTNILTSTFRNFAMAMAFATIFFANTKATSYLVAFTTLCILITAAGIMARRVVSGKIVAERNQSYLKRNFCGE